MSMDSLAEMVTRADTSSSREAIGAVVRCGAVLAGLVRLLEFSATRLPSLKVLSHLTCDAYDAEATRTRSALLHGSAIVSVRSLIYLSPAARSGGAGSFVDTRRVVFYALAVLTNLTRTREAGRATLSAKSLLEELCGESERASQWTTAAIREGARACLENAARATSACSVDATARSQDAEVSGCVFSEELVQEGEPPELLVGAPTRAPRPPRQAPTAAPSARPGFHSVAASFELFRALPTFIHRPPTAAAAAPVDGGGEPGAGGDKSGGDESGGDESGGDEVCTICLEAFQAGDELRALPCVHRFHSHCIESWVQSRVVAGCSLLGCRCPNCNLPIRLPSTDEQVEAC